MGHKKKKRGGGGGAPPPPRPTAAEPSKPPPQEQSTREAAVEERRKKIEAQVKEGRILQQRLERLQSFWDSISPDKKSKFLAVRIEDLRDHLITTCVPLTETFDDAISYGKQSKNDHCWEAWFCSHCNHILTDAAMQLQHLLKKHGKPPSEDAYNVAAVGLEWAETVVNGVWEPVDVPEAIKIITEKPVDCSIEELKNQKWPAVDDPERALLLAEIRKSFKHLFLMNCLTTTNLAYVMNYATDRLRVLVPPSHQKDFIPKMAELHASICFLDAAQLAEVLAFLEAVYDVCNSLEKLPDKDGSLDSALNKTTTTAVIQERVVFSDDKSCLVLDDKTCNRRYLLADGSFMNWLFYGGGSIWDDLELWKDQRAENIILVNKFFQVTEETVELVQMWCNTRKELCQVETTLSSLKTICDSEEEMRQQDSTYARKSYIYLLKRRQDEVDSQELELVVISGILDRFGTQSNDNDLFQHDDSVRRSMMQKIDIISAERSKVDARMLKTYSVMDNLLNRFRMVSGVDYRAILLPIIKSFLKEKIEKHAPNKKAGDDISESTTKDTQGDTSTASASKSASANE